MLRNRFAFIAHSLSKSEVARWRIIGTRIPRVFDSHRIDYKRDPRGRFELPSCPNEIATIVTVNIADSRELLFRRTCTFSHIYRWFCIYFYTIRYPPRSSFPFQLAIKYRDNVWLCSRQLIGLIKRHIRWQRLCFVPLYDLIVREKIFLWHRSVSLCEILRKKISSPYTYDNNLSVF